MPRRRRSTRHGGQTLMRSIGRTAAIAGTATAVSGALRRRQANHASHVETEPATAEPPTPPAQRTGITDDQLARLERLAELHKAGILSDHELEVEKAGILGR